MEEDVLDDDRCLHTENRVTHNRLTTMKTNITLEQALQKASRRLRDKMIYSVNLLQKAENLAIAYGGVIRDITSLLVQEKIRRHSITLQSWQE